MTPRLATAAFLALIAAIFILGPMVSFATPADRWVVKAPGPGEKAAPTRIITGNDPAYWPADYVPARVGEACDCSKRYAGERELSPGMPLPKGPNVWCPLKSRPTMASECEVKK